MTKSESQQQPVHKVGVLRIYLSATDRTPAQTWVQRLFRRPLYQEIIDKAREAGLWAATAKGVTYGFTHEGAKAVASHPDAGFANMHIFVELVAPRPLLEAFFSQITPLIGNRVATFGEVEHWGEVPASAQVGVAEAT